MGQFSVNMLIILLGEGPLSALSTGRTREVFNHMWSTLFANSFDINKQNYAGWIKKGGERWWLGKRRGAGKPCQHLPPCCRAGFGWGALIHIPWQSLAVVLLLLILSPLGSRQSRIAIHSTLNHFNHNTKDLHSHQR